MCQSRGAWFKQCAACGSLELIVSCHTSPAAACHPSGRCALTLKPKCPCLSLRQRVVGHLKQCPAPGRAAAAAAAPLALLQAAQQRHVAMKRLP
jgi:hypothetical protein